ncbi:MAG: AI-2E family transporter [Patescibacteria group bacterium]|nr:AI-2E family transporter [Patescibacteria group bacterium]
MDRILMTRVFLLVLLFAVLGACFLVFKPFLIVILVAAVLASIFYRPYEWLAKKLGGRKKIAALIMCVLIILVIIIPLTNLIVFGAQKSVAAYSDMMNFLNTGGLENTIEKSALKNFQELFNVGGEGLKALILDVAQKSSNFLMSGAAGFLKGTTTFLISLILIIFTLFFFFIDGQKMLERLMYWTPLPDKYDHLIIKKFRDVSYSVFLSTFLVALVQASLIAAVFFIVGLPAFFPAIATALLSMIPFFGAWLVWLPAGIYLLAIGHIWQGIFMILFGAAIISTVDNVIRMFVIKGKAEVHPIFILFSVLGGIALFGFWGIVIGPLLISLAVTILNIYDELEYSKILHKKADF